MIIKTAAALLLLMFPTAVGPAQETGVPGSPTRSDTGPSVERFLEGRGPLAIEDAITLAIGNNRPLRYSRFDRALAAAQARLGYRRFFPSLELGYSQSDAVAY